MSNRLTWVVALLAVFAWSQYYPLAWGDGKPVGRDSSLDAKLERLAKGLKTKSIAKRIKAAQEAGELGEDASPLAGHLCELLTDPSAKVRQAAIEAIEKVRPDLYKPLVKVLVETDLEKVVGGIQELGALEEKGSPAIPFLLKNVKKGLANQRITKPVKLKLVQAAVEALTMVGPNDPDVIKCLLALASSRAPDLTLRGVAIQSLGTIVQTNQKVRKQALPAILAALSNPQLQFVAIEAAGNMGADAKSAIPTLKKLKLSPSEEIREKAAEAVDKINGLFKSSNSSKGSIGLPSTIKLRDAEKLGAETDPTKKLNAALTWNSRAQQPDGRWKTGMGNSSQALVATTSFCALALMVSGDKYRAQVELVSFPSGRCGVKNTGRAPGKNPADLPPTPLPRLAWA
jgi:hypothetical protein